MERPKHLTTPRPSPDLPRGIPYIIGNEAAERFSFYGMKSILFIFLTQYLLGVDGSSDVLTDSKARIWIHSFVFWAYFFPIIGAVISDAFFGKYRTIICMSTVYCLGHLALALGDTQFGLMLGLSPRNWLVLGLLLIAIGAGGIKPCVSAHVGDQFGRQNQHLLSKVFLWFYFSINLGAFASPLLVPVLLNRYGPGVAFGVPGVLMFIATVVFWMGRHKFVHVPPAGWDNVREAFRGDGLQAIRSLVPIYVFVAMFWSLFDQTASAWVQQATKMDRLWLGIEWLPSQIQAVNPFLILILIPLFSFVIYPALNQLFALTPLRKVSIGFFLTVVAFSISAWIETQITAGIRLNIGWQFLAYVVLTAAEIMVSITCLEFS